MKLIKIDRCVIKALGQDWTMLSYFQDLVFPLPAWRLSLESVTAAKDIRESFIKAWEDEAASFKIFDKSYAQLVERVKFSFNDPGAGGMSMNPQLYPVLWHFAELIYSAEDLKETKE